ncbi:ABC transporter permease [Verrucomicrobia bacterium]|nr:ABC transporter permease [Verrucomicrobiota bacterium]
MNILPIVEREFRVASRGRWTPILRVLMGLGALVAAWIGFEETKYSRVGGGDDILVSISYSALIFCGFAGAFLTADSISFEKREGTLGLLLLSNLSPIEIVLGKLASGGLRFLVLLMAMIPFMMLPLLKGGVTWVEVIRSWLALISVFSFSASLGLLVSAYATEARTAVMSTFSIILLFTLLPLLITVVLLVFMGGNGNDFVFVMMLSPLMVPFQSINDMYNSGGGDGIWAYWLSVLYYWVLSVGCVFWASRQLTKSWWSLAFGSSDDSGSKKKKSGAIGLNAENPPKGLGRGESPYGWLVWSSYQRVKSLKWFSWFLILLALAGLAGSLFKVRDSEVIFVIGLISIGLLHLMLKVDVELESVRQIHVDAREGGLELLMCTPLSEKQILNGMYRGMKTRSKYPSMILTFLNFLLILMILFMGKPLHLSRNDYAPFLALFIGGMIVAWVDFRVIPWIGAYQAVKRKTQLTAGFVTIALVHLLPWLLVAVSMTIAANSGSFRSGEAAVLFGGFAIVFGVWAMILKRLYKMKLMNHLREMVSEGG